MTLVSTIIGLLLLFSTGVADVDGLFSYGADASREKRALEILERALAANPNDYDLLWRAARSYYYVGDGLQPKKERFAQFERGIDAGKRAIAQNPNGVEGHFWLGAVWGGYLRDKGGLTAFRNIKNVRTEMEIVVKLKPDYEEGNAYLALGEIDRQLPGLFGGNLKRGIATLETGLKIAPTNPEIKAALGEALIEANRKNEALVQLQEALQAPLSSTRAPHSRKAKERAQRLLNKLQAK
jgi:tetratricopeptide (TPR) repeat protein